MQTSLFEREVAKIEAMRPLRVRQLQALVDVRKAIAEGHKHIVLQAHTGWGKTLWASHVIASALHKGKRPLFTAPAISLIDQTLEAFEAEGIHDIGVMQAQHHRTNPNAALQIASVQTLIRRALPEVDLVITDEAHEIFDAFYALLDNEWKDKIVIALSATPWTRGMGLHYTKLIIGGTLQDAIADGYARKYKIYGPPVDVDRESIPLEKGEFKEQAAATAMSDATIIGNVLEHWKEYSTGDKTFMFCVNRDHAKEQMEAFQDAGIPFGYIDANTPQGVSDSERGTRKHIFAQMRAGEIAGIGSVGCLIRGVDEIVHNIVDLALTNSEMRHVQKWGRMRTGDPNAIYTGFDHAGNNQNLGAFWDIHHDTLDTRAPGDRKQAYEEEYKPAKPRKCGKCHTLVPAGSRVCPSCSEKLPLHSGVTVKDGRLVEIGTGPKKPPINKKHQQWYSELLHVSRKAGYKDGWAAFKFQAKFGIMPTGLKPRGKSSTSDEVKAFVKEQRKIYLESKSAKQSQDRTSMSGVCRGCGGTSDRLCGHPCY